MISKMFTINDERMITWNPFTGCYFNCCYCWARKLAETKLKKSYPEGFTSTTHPDRFTRRFKPNDFVFVWSMGDIAFAPPPVWRVVSEHVQKYPQTNFLLCTKSPHVFSQSIAWPNLLFGSTIETNRHYPEISKAPPVHERYKQMSLIYGRKFLSIEPIMDFDLNSFIQWVINIKPEIVEIGADNYHNNLPEPGPDKLAQFLVELRDYVPTVIEKPGLERLLPALNKTETITLPTVVRGLRQLMISGIKPTQRICHSIPGYTSIRRYVPQAKLIAMARGDAPCEL